MRIFARAPSRSAEALPIIPIGLRIFAVGDIHGRADLLERLLAQISRKIKASDEQCVVVFLGDVIDRGPESRKVIDLLINFSITNRTICLRGNHEALLLAFMNEPSRHMSWLTNGGVETLCSYGIDVRGQREIDSDKIRSELLDALGDHLTWIAQTPLFFELGSLFFVHAGVRPKISFRRQNARDLLFIKDAFLGWPHAFEKYVVHGHTPVPAVEIRSNRANVDTGAYLTDRLSCLELCAADWLVLSTKP